MLIVITHVPLNKTYFGKKYHEFKNGGISTPSELICLGRLEIEIYRSSQIPTRPCQNHPSRLLRFHRWSINKMKMKKLKPPVNQARN